MNYLRLQKYAAGAAFGDSDFKDAIYNLYGSYTDGPYPSLEMAVEEALSGDSATTNAGGLPLKT